MFQSSNKDNHLDGKNSGKSFFAKFIEKMAGLNVIDRRRSTDRRKSCAGYTGPERRSGIDRRLLDSED